MLKVEEKISAAFKAQIEAAMGDAFDERRVLPDGQFKKVALLSAEEKAGLEQGKLAQPAAGILAPITEMEIFGMPLGQAAVGGGIALMATELIDAFITAPPTGVPMTRVLVKGVAGFAMIQFLGGALGADVARVAAMFLGFSLLRDLLPIDEWIRNIVKGMAGAGTTNNPTTTETNPAGSNGHSQDAMTVLATHLSGAGR